MPQTRAQIAALNRRLARKVHRLKLELDATQRQQVRLARQFLRLGGA